MKTNVYLILDKSGSMEAARPATISGFNEYLQTLRADTESEYEITLTLFDTGIEVIKDVRPLTASSYVTGGGTALYDAVCSTLKAREALEISGEKSLVMVLTDGEENSSKEYAEKDFKAIVERLTAKGSWTFAYLGANQDAWGNAQKWGFAQGNVVDVNATTSGQHANFASLARSTVNLAKSETCATMDFFSAEDKDKLKNA